MTIGQKVAVIGVVVNVISLTASVITLQQLRKLERRETVLARVR